MSTWYNSENNTIPMFYEQKMVNEIDTAKFADVGCNVHMFLKEVYINLSVYKSNPKMCICLIKHKIL